MFRTSRDADITKRIYHRFPVLINEETGENPWGITFMTMFHMSNDSGLFRTRDELEGNGFEMEGNTYRSRETSYLPLYEGKMIHHFDHRYATFDPSNGIRNVTPREHQDPAFAPMPRYWVDHAEVDTRLAKRDRQGVVVWQWEQPWLVGIRTITNSTNERTVIVSLLPRVAAGNSLLLCLPNDGVSQALLLVAVTSSLVFDFVARQAVGGNNLNLFTLEQLPTLRPSDFGPEEEAWVVDQVTFLTTSGGGPLTIAPSRRGQLEWDEARRLCTRAAIDAFMFRKFLLSEDDVCHVLDTFGALARSELATYEEFRTKRLVLEALRERPWRSA